MRVRCVGLVVALVALDGWAGGEGSPSAPDSPRLRAFIGGATAVGEGFGLHVGAVGVAGDLGVQWSERFSVSAQLRATSTVVLNQALGAVSFEGCVTPSVCLGLGAGGALNFGPLYLVPALALPASVGWQRLWPTNGGGLAGVRVNLELVGLYAPTNASARFGFTVGVSIGFLRR